MGNSTATRLVFVGGGRLAGMLYAVFHRTYDIIGYVDDVYASAYLTQTYGVPCLGTSDALAALKADDVRAVVSITDATARARYGDLLDSLGFEMETLIFPTAVIDEFARVGRGCIVRHQAVVSAQVELGRNCVVSDNAYVGHDSVIGAHTYISPGVNINGSVTIGEASFIGTGAVVLPERRVGAGCTVGAAACVVADVPGGQTVAGVPARELDRPARPSAMRPRPSACGPLVSVLMASYNHELHVAEAVKSALDQTLQDIELIIVDDGSTDGTVEAIRRFDDPRIRFAPLDHNHGLAIAKTRALEMAGGTYVAILNSDDAFLPDKLEKQVAVARENPELGAVFSGVEVIDDRGDPFCLLDHPCTDIFRQPNRTRTEWLRHFFYLGNCLCAPSALLPRERLLEVGYLDQRFRQVADLDLWIRLCQRHPIHIHPKPLTRYRVHDGSANASALTAETSMRGFWEHAQLLSHYLRIPDETELLRVFPEAAAYVAAGEPLDADGIAYAVARLALAHGGRPWEGFALQTLFGLLEGDDRAYRIRRRFGFGYRELIDLTGRLDVFRVL
jgi:sugar O-acyltransferase (sialic acid O-acetyltransferase NeuD family)